LHAQVLEANNGTQLIAAHRIAHRTGNTDAGSIGNVETALMHSETDNSVATPRSLLGAAASFAGSMAKFAASGFQMVHEGLHQLRMGERLGSERQ
jgi:hypothetical protein